MKPLKFKLKSRKGKDAPKNPSVEKQKPGKKLPQKSNPDEIVITGTLREVIEIEGSKIYRFDQREGSEPVVNPKNSVSYVDLRVREQRATVNPKATVTVIINNKGK